VAIPLKLGRNPTAGSVKFPLRFRCNLTLGVKFHPRCSPSCIRDSVDTFPNCSRRQCQPQNT
jgi:hypothetical protein